MNELTKDLSINVSALAKDINVSHTNIWFYFNGQRKWNLEAWLNTLAALGCIEIHKYGGLLLKIPVDNDLAEHFESLHEKRSTYIRD